MALDEAILEAAGCRQALPTLRLYAWQPACLSLGYAQPFTDADQTGLVDHGWQLVRRPTGGRAILHIDELTYSVCGPLDEPRLAGSVLESYRILSGALLVALNLLGIQAEAVPQAGLQAAPQPGKSIPTNPVCFEAPSNYEITFNGKKLIGSAQARRKEGVLQHGSLPLTGDLARITQALSFPDEPARCQAAERLLKRAATAETALGHAPTWEQAAQAFIAAFQQALNLELLPAEPDPAELQRAEQLVRDKYAHPTWNEKT